MKKDNDFSRLLLLSIVLFSFLIFGKTLKSQITTYPYQQGWETNSIDDWSQVIYDDDNWASNSGTTSSTSTGPSGANEGTYYIYCETSGSAIGDEYVLESPEFDFSALSNPQFAFDYHMYFNNYSDGTLNIDISTNLGASWTTIHTITGHQQSNNADPWLTDTISLLSYAGETSVMFRLFFTTGSGTTYQYDMSVDYVQVMEGPALLAIDAGITAITAPTGNVAAGNPIPVHATIKNFGTTTLTTADMCFSVNGGATQSTTWNGSLTQNTIDVNVYIDDAVFSGGVNSLKVWTESPNGLGDMQNANDTTEINITGEVPLSGVYTVGSVGADFTSFTNPGGVFETVNTTIVSGDMVFEVISDITTETGTHALNQWAESGAGAYTMTIRPDGNTLRTIEGNYQGTGYSDEGLYRLDSVSRVCFDGRDPNNLSAGGRYLLFRNTNKISLYYQSTFCFITGCHEDTLRFLNIEGAAYMYSVGIVRFGRWQKGNYNILIDNCHIRDLSTTGDAVGSGIYSYGVSSSEMNRNITITNNEIYNIWRGNTDNGGVYIASYSTDFTIEGNHFYLSVAKNPTGNSTKYGVYIKNNGDNYKINNNYFGGQDANCGGSPMTLSSASGGRFCGIYLEADEFAVNNEIQNNKIANIDWKYNRVLFNPNVFTAIYHAQGSALIKNNIIGSFTTADSILVNIDNAGDNSTTRQMFVYGILAESGNATIRDNIIRDFNTDRPGATGAVIFFAGIRIEGDATATISNNLIGSETEKRSININHICNNLSNSPINYGQVYGISNGSTANVTIDSNIVANMYSANTSYVRPQIAGISSYTSLTSTEPASVVSISNNTVHSLSIPGNYNQAGHLSGCAGIVVYHAGTPARTVYVRDNLVYNLESTTTNTGQKGITGIAVHNSAPSNSAYAETIRNVVHGLKLNAADEDARIEGMYFSYGGHVVANNMIRLGYDADGNNIGKYDIQGIRANRGDFYYNTVYIGGTATVGSTPTYAFTRNGANNWTTNIKNNIFINERTNSGATSSHFGMSLIDIANISSDYNCLYAPNSGGNIGEIESITYNALGNWQTAITDDYNSISGEVFFVDKLGPSSTVDLHIDISQPSIIESAGTVLASISDDIDLEIRYGAPGSISSGTAPDIGADEINFSPLPISLLDFNASCLDETTVLIRWATASETNNAYFTIERSLDGILWSEIAQISGAGNSNQVKNYEYICTSSKEYPEYYRLKQTDYNGSYEYFKPITISCTTNEEAVFEIYPNPFKDNFTIFYSNGADETAIISIYDTFGKLVYLEQANEMLNKISVEDFAKGCYIVQFRTNNFTKTVKLIKQ